MRILKFRAFQDRKMTYSHVNSNYKFVNFFNSLYEDAPVMQFTGLKDKNSKEIYEGDILNEKCYPPDKGGNYNNIPVFVKDKQITVGFDHGCFIAEPFDAHLWRYICNYNDMMKTDYEIIGNIYETPELI